MTGAGRRLAALLGRLRRWSGRAREPAGVAPAVVEAVLEDARAALGARLRITGERVSRTGCHILWLGNGEGYIAKVAVHDGGRRRLRDHVAALETAARAPWLTVALAQRIPRVVRTGEAAGRFYSVETRLHGESGTCGLGRPRWVATASRTAAEFLMELHTASRQGSDLGRVAWQDRFAPVMEEVGELVRRHGGDPAYARLRAGLEAALDGAAIPSVLAHGNFWIGNVLCDAEGRVTGVVDWDMAMNGGLPLVDLLYFLLRTESVTGRTSLGETATRWFAERCRPATGHPLVGRYCGAMGIPSALVAPLLCFCWLQQVHAHVRYGSPAVTDSRWLGRNVLSVVRHAAAVV